jgi:hypothetical protein
LAYTYHIRCVTLAQTLIPRNLTSLDWYMVSSTFVEQYRARKIREEEAISGENMKIFRIELATDLQELEKKATEDAHHFLLHIYTKHPPRKGNVEMGSVDSDHLLKTIKKAILHYHPDSQSSFNDEKWSFLCGEITKILNTKYEKLKHVS